MKSRHRAHAEPIIQLDDRVMPDHRCVALLFLPPT
jgi:hypothetical protein